MTMKKLITSVALLAVMLLATTTRADAYSGQFDFTKLDKAYGEPTVEVNLNSTMLGFVAGLSKVKNAETSEMLSKLENIQVRTYAIGSDVKAAMDILEETTKKIQKDKWEPVVKANEEGEKVRIYAKYKDNKMLGLVVMNVSAGATTKVDENGKTVQIEPQGEAVFINIKGEIDPDNISKVTESLDIKL